MIGFLPLPSTLTISTVLLASYQLCYSNYIVRPSGAKKITMPSVQSNYIAMGPMMADKADPNNYYYYYLQ